MNLKSFDLNLLRVFAAMDRARNVSRAASLVGLSQPAMSNALSRLRQACDDVLFVRTQSGMEPTALAIEMAPAIHEAIAQIERALGGHAEFRPETVQRGLRLLLSNAGQSAILPPLLGELERRAPGISVETIQMPREQYAEALQMGLADLAIGSLALSQSGIYQQVLFSDHYCCIAAQDHPVIKDSLTSEQFCNSRHIWVRSGGSEASLDRALAAQDRQREVVLKVHEYYTAIEIVRRTTLVAMVPLRSVVGVSGLQILDLPVTLSAARVRMLWHQRLHQDPANLWLRDLLREICAGRSFSVTAIKQGLVSAVDHP